MHICSDEIAVVVAFLDLVRNGMMSWAHIAVTHMRSVLWKKR